MHGADVNGDLSDLTYCPTKLFKIDLLDRAPSRKRQSARFLDSPPPVSAITKSYTIEVILRKRKQDGKSGCNPKVSKIDNDQFKTKKDGKSRCKPKVSKTDNDQFKTKMMPKIGSESEEDDGIEYKIAFEKDGPSVPVSDSFGFPIDKTLLGSSNLMPCPSTGPKIVCASPNVLCLTKIYLGIVTVPIFLC